MLKHVGLSLIACQLDYFEHQLTKLYSTYVIQLQLVDKDFTDLVERDDRAVVLDA